MPTIRKPAKPSTAADAFPGAATDATPAPTRQAKRWFSLRGGEKAKQFALSLKTNARWMKQFLHGGR